MTSLNIQPRYLGDGVYASFDGYQIWLQGNADDRENRIALEPAVLRALHAYEREIGKALSIAHKPAE